MHCETLSAFVSALIMTTEISLLSGSLLMTLRTSSPFKSGIIRSRRMRLNFSFSISAIASFPPAALAIRSWPSVSSINCSVYRLSSLSSTIRIPARSVAMNTSSSSRSATPHFRCARTRRSVATSRSNSIGLVSNSSHPVAIAFSRSPASARADKAMMGMSWVCELPFRGRAASQPSTTGIEGDDHRDFKPELYPQNHGQEHQDRVQRDPHDVGSPTPPILYGLLAHGEFSLA